MKIMTTTYTKINFDKTLNQALAEPVFIVKSEISDGQLQHEHEAEDQYWIAEAIKSKLEGFISTEKSNNLIDELLRTKA